MFGLQLGRLGLSGGAAVAKLPAGAIGIWYADQYVETPRRAIPNAAVSSSPSQSIIAIPRRLFNNTNCFVKVGVTVTDENATAPDDTTSASTLVGTGNWYVSAASNTNLPVGTYTVAISARRSGGSDQVFAFTHDNTATRSPVKTATSSWQRFSYTFTRASALSVSQVLLCSSDGSTGASLEVCDFEIYQGASDLGPAVPDGHILVGMNHYDSGPACSAGELDLSAGGFGFTQFLDLKTLTNGSTFSALVKRVGTTSYNVIFSKIQSYVDYSVMFEEIAAPKAYFSSQNISPSQVSGLWNLQGLGYHVLTLRRTATTLELWLDDCCVSRSSPSVSAVTVRDLFVGGINGLQGSLKLNSAALWDKALTDQELKKVVTVFQARALRSSITAASVARVYCAEGDSITATGSPKSYAYLSGVNHSPATIGVNYAVSGSLITDLVTRATNVDAIIPTEKTGRKFILSVLIGANDIGQSKTNGELDTWLSSVASYCDARRAAGWLVIICTITPSSSASRNSNRNYVNPIIRTWVGTHVDAVADFAADATVGTDAAGSNATYYPDGLHPSAATHAILEPIFTAAVNSL